MSNFIPKKIIKLKKNFKSDKSLIKTRTLTNGNFGVVSTTYCLVTYRQLEAMRRYISRRLHKKNKKLIRISLTHKMFKKASKSRMGKGSGKFYKWFGYIRPGSLIFEFTVLSYNLTKVLLAFKTIKTKLPFSCVLRYRLLRFFK